MASLVLDRSLLRGRRAPGPDMTALRSSQLFEGPAALPLSDREQVQISHLNFFKKWYLLTHLVYIVVVISIGSFLFLLFEEGRVPFVDALFIATSAVCNCGLSTVDVELWSTPSIVTRHVIMFMGGVVFTSAFPSWLRLFLLRHVRTVFEERDGDSPQEHQLRKLERRYADRLRRTSLLSVSTTYGYISVFIMMCIVILYVFNSSNLSFLQMTSTVTSSFHGCVFTSMEAYASDRVYMGVVSLCCAMGFTAFPVVLRYVFLCELLLARVGSRLRSAIAYRRRHGRSEAVAVAVAVEEEEDLDLEPLLEPCQDSLPTNPWELALNDIMSSTSPGTYHPFLFLAPETAFLGLAWCFFTLLLAAPMWWEQWGVSLAPFAPSHKLFVALCQAASTRFAAATFVPISEFSNAHVAVVILAMFLPALPISTDRTYLKWQQMFRTSLVRLLTSRLFWLFAAMLAFLFAEEGRLRAKITGSRYDLMTRTFFEIISAYSGCGLSLSLPSSTISFVGEASAFSKMIIILVLIGGRHRFVDLGIDLGFATLQDIGPSPASATSEPRVGDASE